MSLPMSRAQLTAQTCDLLTSTSTDRLTQQEPRRTGSADVEAKQDFKRIILRIIAIHMNAANAPFVRITSGCAYDVDVILDMPTEELARRRVFEVQNSSKPLSPC